MMHIRRVRIVMPARFAATAPQAAREIAERMVNAAHDQPPAPRTELRLPDTGTPAQIGLAAGRLLGTTGDKP